MQFAVIARDFEDGGAIERRTACRAAHLAHGDEMRRQGQLLYAVAMLDESEKMVGSIMIVDFPAKDDLDCWLKVEPYIVGRVWEKVEITRCRVGPSFVQVSSSS